MKILNNKAFVADDHGPGFIAFKLVTTKIKCHMCGTYTAVNVFLPELTKHILEEHENSQASVVTKRFEEARKFLQENPFLILTGHDGEGLTTLGYDLLLDYPEREQFIVMERKEALPCMTQSTDKQVIVFADDVFGTTYFDEKRYESWCRNMSQLQKLIKRNKAILILAIHLKFMKASQCKVFCDYYQDNMLNVSKPRLQLDFKERNKILLCNITSQMDLLHIEICRTKQEETTTKDAGETGRKCVKLSEQTIDDIARMSLSSGFPGKVAHFLKNVDNIKQGVHFFIMPTPEMFEEIDSFRTSKAEEDFQIYLALVAVFVYGSLNFDTFEIHCQYLAKSEKALRNYLATCSGKSQRLGQRTKCPDMINVLTGFAKKFKLLTELAGSVKKGVFLMLGRYLNEKDHMKGHYSVSSVSVERAVAISCAKEYPIDICKYSSKHIFNAVIDPDNAFEKKEMHISLREKDKDVCLAVMERLQLIQLPNKLLEFIQHPAMRVAWFAKLFIKHVKKSKHALKTMIMECDDKSGASLLSLSLKYPYIAPGAFNTQCFAEDLMLSGKWPKIRKENPIFAKEKEQELLEKCCEMGWTESYFRLVEKLQLLPTKACLSLTITSGNIDILTDLSRNMSLTKDDWYLALQRACKKLEENDRETMKIILFISKDIVPFEYQSQKIESIMHSAARSGDDVLLSKVISFYNDKNLKNRQGLTCLHLATQGNHHFCVQLALDNDVSQRVPDPKGELPLHYACRLGFTEITKLLVERDSDVVHRVSNSRSTPLHLSAENGHFEITKFLVINGAKLNTVDKKGRTPAYCAARFSTGIILDYLLENEIDGSLKVPTQTAVTERTGNTVKLSKHSRKQKITVRKQNLLDDCLIDVMREQCPESEKIDGIRHLLRMEANLNYVKEDVLPLLQLGIECRCSGNIIDFLLRNGVSVCQRDLQTGDNALHKAVKHGNKEIIQLILGNKTNIENLLRQRNKENETPLHIAVDSGSATLVKLLKTESTTKDFVVKQGRCLTPLALAEEKRDHSSDRSGRRKYEEVIKILSQSRS